MYSKHGDSKHVKSICLYIHLSIFLESNKNFNTIMEKKDTADI